ncbi:MAG: SPOR domain-containing protein [bacterium]|nr:SPOR domain-containing protein [bacterium]
MLDIDNTIMINEDNLWKLQVGDYSNYNTAAQMLRQIREMGFSDSWITRRQIK